LLHGCCTDGKACMRTRSGDDRYSTNRLEAIYVSFVLGASLLKKSLSDRSAVPKQDETLL
jgi:hypothetical protein